MCRGKRLRHGEKRLSDDRFRDDFDNDGEMRGVCELGSHDGCPGGCAGTWRRSSDDVPVIRGVNFAPDSIEGAGSAFYFTPDSGEEVSSELQVQPVVDSELVPDSLVEDLGSIHVVPATVDFELVPDFVLAEDLGSMDDAVDASSAELELLDATAKMGRVEVPGVKADGPCVELSLQILILLSLDATTILSFSLLRSDSNLLLHSFFIISFEW